MIIFQEKKTYDKLEVGVDKKTLRNRIDRKTKPKNRLTETSGLVLVFVLHKSRFRFIKYKNRGFS